MQYSEEWKSLVPISLAHTPSLLVFDTALGPLHFNPVPETLTNVLSLQSHCQSLILPPPRVSLPRFIETTSLRDSNDSILHSHSNAIASSFGPQHYGDDSSRQVLYNRIEPLRCPNDWVIVFFPTGENSDRVGFIVLTGKGSNVGVVDFGRNDGVFVSSVKFDHRIIRLAACNLSDFDDVDDSGRVGFLVACTMYGAQWFRVRVTGLGSKYEKPALDYMGCKVFKTCAVAYACWSPHLPGECVILLENGALFLFDMASSCFKGKRMSVEWNEVGQVTDDGWISCEFSWHCRTLIVVNSKAVFQVDFRFGKCQVICLVKTEMLGIFEASENEQVIVFSKAGNDGLFFTVATTHWLLLCDVRKPLMPVLWWDHNLNKPCYMTVFPLSELRSHPLDQKYVGTSEMGSAVLLGSLWYNEFSLFCFGRPISSATQSSSTKLSKFSGSFYAWEHPSELNLSGNSCGCGSCLLKEEFVKDELPEWIEWQQKREVVLGFFILDKDLSQSLPCQGEHGGFTLVRLMASGKLETQQYFASWKMAKTSSIDSHGINPLCKDSLLCNMGDDEYRFKKKFSYIKLDYLFAHLSNNLARLLFSKFEGTRMIGCADQCSDEFSEFITEKLRSFGCAPPISHLSTSDIFSDVNMPTSLYEIVTRLMWISLPMSNLEMAFSSYRTVSLEFPSIPSQNQAPPFFLKTPSHQLYKGSSRNTRGSEYVGPVVPLHALLALYEISKSGHSFITQVNDYSPEKSIALKCKPVVSLAKELGITNSSNDRDKEHAVSLGDDKDDDWVDSSNPNSLFLYEPSAFSDEFPSLDKEDPETCLKERERLVSKVAKSKFQEDVKSPNLFDGLCPVELQFNSDDDQSFDSEELNSLQFLKKQFSQWQHGFQPCQSLFELLKL